MTQRELCNSYVKSNTLVNAVTKATLKNTVIAVGKLRLTTFNKKFPFTISLFGSSAKIKDGVPMVKVVIKVSWIGTKKYLFQLFLLFWYIMLL